MSYGPQYDQRYGGYPGPSQYSQPPPSGYAPPPGPPPGYNNQYPSAQQGPAYYPPTFPPPPSGPERLPQGWVSRYDDRERLYYYTNLSTGVSQWAHPDAVAPQNLNPNRPYGERVIEQQPPVTVVEVPRDRSPDPGYYPAQNQGINPINQQQKKNDNWKLAGVGAAGVAAGVGTVLAYEGLKHEKNKLEDEFLGGRDRDDYDRGDYDRDNYDRDDYGGDDYGGDDD